ncbi:MAG: hypothetical protein AB7K24_07580 [Gemmataceae bacterium]
MIRCLCVLGFFLFASGCEPAKDATGKSEQDAAPVIPSGFNEQLLDILRCPENLAVLRLATRKELDSVNERIKNRKLKTWTGKNVATSLEAMLIRADNKIAYRFDGAVPVMILEDALVLDETVGAPDPDKYRKK